MSFRGGADGFVLALGAAVLVTVGFALDPPVLVFVLFLVVCAVVILRNRPLTLEALAGKARAADLGWIRVVVCVAALAYVMSDSATAIYQLPAETSSGPRGILAFLYWLPIGFESLRGSQLGLQVLHLSTIALLLLAAAGLKTRQVLPLATLGCLVLAGLHREFTHFYHAGMLPIYVLIVLCFTPCGDGFSVDRRMRSRKDAGARIDVQEDASYRYGFSRYACWLVVALTYFFLGMSKLRDGGLDWWNAGNLKTIAASDSLQLATPWFDFDLGALLARLPDPLAAGFGIAGCYGESLAILLLFSVGARRIVPVILFGMHLGILLVQELPFPDLLVLPFMFLRVDRLTWIRGRATPAGRDELPVGAGGPSRLAGQRALLLGVLVALGVANLGQVNYFPLTPWRMYSQNRSDSPAWYYKLHAHEVGGAVRRIRPAEMLEALPRNLGLMQLRGLAMQAGSSGELRARQFLQRAAQVHDLDATDEHKIARFELELWRWDFREEPDDPEHGEVVRRYDVEVGAEPDRLLLRDTTIARLIQESLLSYRTERFAECIERCQQVLELDPANAVAHNNICSAYSALGEWELAIDAGRRALEADPDFERARSNLRLAEQRAAGG